MVKREIKLIKGDELTTHLMTFPERVEPTTYDLTFYPRDISNSNEPFWGFSVKWPNEAESRGLIPNLVETRTNFPQIDTIIYKSLNPFGNPLSSEERKRVTELISQGKSPFRIDIEQIYPLAVSFPEIRSTQISKLSDVGYELRWGTLHFQKMGGTYGKVDFYNSYGHPNLGGEIKIDLDDKFEHCASVQKWAEGLQSR